MSSALQAAKVSPLIEKVNDHKDFKKLLRTRTNVLVLYTKSGQSISKLLVFQVQEKYHRMQPKMPRYLNEHMFYKYIKVKKYVWKVQKSVVFYQMCYLKIATGLNSKDG